MNFASCCSVTQSCPTLRPHGLQRARLPCPWPSPGTCSNACPLSWWCHPTICCGFAREAHKLREEFHLLDPQFTTEGYNLGGARRKRHTGKGMGSHSTSISMCSPAGMLPEPLPSEFEWRLHCLDVTEEIIDYWWLNSISSASPLPGMVGGGEVGMFSSKSLITGLTPLVTSPHPNQFSSVAQLCLTLCDPMNCSTPGLPVHHQLPESTQTHVHWVSDAIHPSHPLSSPSSPALNLSQHQGLFQWVSSSHKMAKVLEFQLQHQSFQYQNIESKNQKPWSLTSGNLDLKKTYLLWMKLGTCVNLLFTCHWPCLCWEGLSLAVLPQQWETFYFL